MSPTINILKKHLKEYKKKYYKNLIIKGLILFLGLSLSALLVLSFLEHLGHFNSGIRTAFFFFYITTLLFASIKWIILPTKHLFNLQSELSDEEASIQIGQHFPDIGDRLLNTLQLADLSYEQNSLIAASIEQKSKALSTFSFSKAVDYSKNKSSAYRYLLAPATVFLIILLFLPEMFSESASRIVRYNENIIPVAPFQFNILNKELSVFKNENIKLEIQMMGNSIPEEVYFQEGSLKRKLQKQTNNTFTIQLSNISHDIEFKLYAAGFYSQYHSLKVLQRPEIKTFTININYPSYLKKDNLSLKNAGTITVPEGSAVEWKVNTENTNSVHVKFANETVFQKATKSTNDTFTFSKIVKQSTSFQLKGNNKHGENKSKIEYDIEVIKDEYPSISVKEFKDTITYSTLLLSGNIGDDYGIQSLNFNYKLSKKPGIGTSKYTSKRIPFAKNQTHQSYLHSVLLDSLNMQPGDQLEYYLSVSDNDGVNGSKTTRSGISVFQLPSIKVIKDELDKTAGDTQKSFEKTLKEAKTFRKDLKDLKNKLKTKKKLDWQEQKEVEQTLKKQQQLEKNIENLKQQFEKNQAKSERFQKPNEELKQKLEQLDKLMEDLLDEETKKLYEELEKLLKEKQPAEKLNEKLNELDQQDKNLENEIDRTLEMFKQMRFEQKLAETKEQLEKLAEKQEKLAEETKEANKEKTKALEEKQEELNKDFEEIKKELDEMNELNESMKNKNNMGDMNEQQKNVSQEMKDSQQKMSEGKGKKASDSQKKAAQKMKDMAAQMQDMQSAAGAQKTQENLDDLRDILENLITLSFEEESLMKDFRKVRQNDPRFVELSQHQLKLNNDAKIIEDSLLSLANRVFEIQSFVTREVSAMKDYMQQSTDKIKVRQPRKATEKQQYAMTSMNNLALMLSDVMKQLQAQMAQQMQGDQMCNKPGNNNKPGKSGSPKLGDMQKQLNQMIKQLKSGQKSGRQLSEELAKLASQQEKIRRAMKEMQGQGKEPGSKSGEDGKGAQNKELEKKLKQLEKMMEQTEEELVNKNLTQRTIQRQQDILTRLLEAEKSMRERDYDNKREATTGKKTKKKSTPEIDEYLKQKQQEIELLKTIPPNMNPYYKKEVNEYFQTIEN